MATLASKKSQSLEAEQNVLCIVFSNAEQSAMVLEQLRVDHFSDKRHRIIYRAMKDLYGKHEHIDLESVKYHLTSTNKIEAAGGIDYIDELSMYQIDFEKLDDHIMIIKENAEKIKKRKSAISRFFGNLEGVSMSISPLIGYLLFGLIPLFIAVIMSFNDVSGYSLVGMEFVGFHNYLTVLSDEKFWLSLRNTMIMAASMPISLVLSLVMAFFISKGLKGAKIFRVIYFIPFVCSVVAVTYMWQWLFNTNYGVINQWLGLTGEHAIDWLGTETNFLISVIIMNVWSGTGYGIVLYGAALTNVPKTLLEQSEIDGANGFQKFWHVTLPTISPTTFYLFTMGLIGSLQAFAVTNILANNGTGPDDAGLTSVFYIYRNIFSYVNQMGIAAAASWLLAIVITIITSINFVVSKYWVNYD